MSTGTPKKSAVRYTLLGIHASTGGVVEGHRRGSPSESFLCSWGKARGCAFVIRYWPSLKGWRILDIRKAVESRRGSPHNYSIWNGQTRGTRLYPNEDAAVMHALAILSSQPKLL